MGDLAYTTTSKKLSDFNLKKLDLKCQAKVTPQPSKNAFSALSGPRPGIAVVLAADFRLALSGHAYIYLPPGHDHALDLV